MDALLVPAYRFEQVEQRLRLMHRILEQPLCPSRRREWLLEHCRGSGESERRLWRSVAAYRQAGAAALLEDDSFRRGIYHRQGVLAREQILSRLTRAPRSVLPTFCELARIAELIGDRLQFLCDWILEFFLDPDPWLEPDCYDAVLAIEVLLEKLTQEVEQLGEIFASSGSLTEMLDDYRQWLSSHALVGERGQVE